MDILVIVDRLEAVVNEGWRVPFTAKTAIDENTFFDIVDQLRVSIPQELKQANELLAQKDAILAGAAEDADRLIEEARHKAARLVDEHEIAAAARAEAESLKAKAQQEADQFRKEADEYALDALSDLESRLSSLLRQTANGLAALRRRGIPTAPEGLDESS